MTQYSPFSVKLSEGQKKSLINAMNKGEALTMRLSAKQLNGTDELMLTQTQIKKNLKASKQGKGVDLKISKTQIRHVVKQGGSLFTSLMSLGSRMLTYATKYAPKIAQPLATGALTAL